MISLAENWQLKADWPAVRSSTNLHRRDRVKHECPQADHHSAASSFLRIPF